MEERRSRVRAGTVAVLAVCALIGAGCGNLTAGGANETLAPMVRDRPEPPVVQAGAVDANGNTVVNTQGSTTTLPREPSSASVATDDANALSVAVRFLGAVAAGDEATALSLEAPGRDPTVTDWAQAVFAQYTQLAGAQAWGDASCAEPTGTVVACSWLRTDAPPTLILEQQSDGNWLVSHPLLLGGGGEPQAAGRACIAGSSSVNFRGGPGTDWPRFVQLAPDTCDITVFDTVFTDPNNGDRWRLIEADGRRGWIIERVLNMQ